VPRRVGILGGTFNPPHVGHLLCASEAAARFELDAVMLMPVAQPPHKPAPSDPGGEHRRAMCELAVTGDDRLVVSRVELDRPGPSYTIDTLRALHASAPEDELTFIAGGDMAVSLPTWREPEAVLALARVAVTERDALRREDIAAAVAPLEGAGERIAFFDMPRLDVSSSDIRRRVAERRPIRYLVPDPVAGHIAQHGLYRAAVGVR